MSATTLSQKDGSPITNHDNGRWTFNTAEDVVRQIHVCDVATNVSNPRNPAHQFLKMGYGLFQNPEGSQHTESLFQLATSGDAEKMAEYVRVIEAGSATQLANKQSEDDPYAGKKSHKTIVQLAASLEKLGFINPVRLRPITAGANAGKYDIVCGARRFMATLYNCCKKKDLSAFAVSAFVISSAARESEDIALAENITVDPLNKSETILAIRSFIERGKSVEFVASHFATNERTIKRRLNAAYAPPEVLLKLDAGRVGITDVETIGQKIKQGRNPERVVEAVLSRASRRGNATSGRPVLPAPEERKMMTRMVAQNFYETGKYLNGRQLNESNRKLLAKFFGFPKKTVEQFAAEKIAAEAQKTPVAVSNEVRRGRGRPKGSKNKPK